MPKKLPDCPQPPSSGHSASETFTQTYLISVVTPLFGGGVEAGTNDPITAVRGTSIRGHLRFWWRATRGAEFLSIQDLKDREEIIWGSSKTPSKITVSIEIKSNGLKKRCANFVSGKSYTKFIDEYTPFAYVLFPFQGGTDKYGKKTDPSDAAEDVKFALTIIAPKELQLDVEAALWAWINFGGLGARTRRGCGSLYCANFSPNKQSLKDISQWYESSVLKYKIKQKARKIELWSTLPPGKRPSFMINNIPMKHKKSWAFIVDKLHRFRQGAGLGRNEGTGGKKFGRSRWPEADSLRVITKKHSREHPPMSEMPTPLFPRAAFGLPLGFHFKDAREGDPSDVQLEPIDASRMASPVILKPLAISETESVPMVLFLKRPSLSGIKFKYSGSKHFEGSVSEVVNNKNALIYPKSPLRQKLEKEGYTSKGMALVAFSEYLTMELNP
jgi:CRISPR-associated protein Cmr1